MAEKVAAPAKAAPSSGTGATTPSAPPMNWSNFLTIFIFGIALIVLIDQGTRNALGKAVGYVLTPLIAFDNQWPILTLLITGLLMTSLTILVRHFFTNYVKQAENQKIVSAFNKELRDARKNNNTFKMKKLLEMQPQIMAKSLEQTKTQFKLLPATMLIVIPIFAWLSVFVNDLPSTVFAVPWNFSAELTAVFIFPVWIFVYTTVTIPFGQILSRLLRFYSFRKRLDKLAEQAV
jgi:uncharacterized membrane protein (DUF106 family)